MDPITLSLLTIILSLIIYAMYKSNEVNKYWKKRGIPHPKPMMFFGNSFEALLMRKPFSDIHMEWAKQFPDEPYIGIMGFGQPMLMINDHDMIEKILIKDFMYFTNRGLHTEETNAIDTSLFTMEGKEWRALRYKLSPIFTTGKMKKMYGAMAECGEVLSTLLECDENKDVDMKEILGRFTMDVIGSCAFGLDTKNLSQPDSEFRKMGQKVFEPGKLHILRIMFMMTFPKIAKFFRFYSFNRRDVGEYFSKIIRDTVEYRQQNNVVRNDFLQQLMTLKEKGSIEMKIKDPADEYLLMEPAVETFEITEDTMIGQAFSFLTAGFDNTSNTMMFTLYELSKNKDIQDKVRGEIHEIIKTEGSLTYDAVKKMIYLEKCIKETLRKYPPALAITRKCTKDYTLSDGNVLIPGDAVFISIRCVHYNPKYFPEPEEFRPERFNPDQNIPSCAFIPFGNGPRICIAMRFALMQIAYSLAKLLIRYEFNLSPKTKPFRLKTTTFFTAPADPILFNIRKITL